MANQTQILGRRDFMKLGGAGIAATAISAGCATSSATAPAASAVAPTGDGQVAAEPPKAQASEPRMHTLGRTGIKVPRVSMGVMNADNPNLVRAALDGGIRLLDTAHGYQEGRNEEMLGTVLPGRKRDSFVLCTKVFVSTLDRKTGLFSASTRPEEIEEKLTISLKRLGLDYVDVLYLHAQSAKQGVEHEGLLRALEKVKAKGMTRFIGVSTHKNEPEVIRAAIAAKIYDVVLTSYNFRQDHHIEVQKAIGEAAAAGLGIVAMKTQAGLFFDEEKKHPIDMKAALRWAIRDPNVHTAIPGFTTFDQLQDDLAVLRDPQLSPADSKALEAPAKLAGFFCQGCDDCLAPCRDELPIPELMRSYMYGHAYRNREAARSLLSSLDLPSSPCGDCDTCSVVCVKGFDVQRRIRNIVRLLDVPKEFVVG